MILQQLLLTLVLIIILAGPQLLSHVPSIDVRLLLEYIKVLIWPLIVGSSLFYFRENIKSLIDRLVEIKAGAFSATASIIETKEVKMQSDEINKQSKE